MTMQHARITRIREDGTVDVKEPDGSVRKGDLLIPSGAMDGIVSPISILFNDAGASSTGGVMQSTWRLETVLEQLERKAGPFIVKELAELKALFEEMQPHPLDEGEPGEPDFSTEATAVLDCWEDAKRGVRHLTEVSLVLEEMAKAMEHVPAT